MIWVRRVPSTPELEPLRLLSERLAARYGWQPAQATVYVPTGAIPVSGVRVTTRDTLPRPGGAARWTVRTYSACLCDGPGRIRTSDQSVGRGVVSACSSHVRFPEIG